MIKKIAFIAHPSRDAATSKRFFGEILGLELAHDYGEMWSEFVAPDGKTIAVDTVTPKNVDDPRVYLALETDDIDAEVARLKQEGVTVVMDVWSNEGDDGRTICKMAVILDPDGNPLMLHEIAPWRAGAGAGGEGS